jgi:hypothetical protein
MIIIEAVLTNLLFIGLIALPDPLKNSLNRIERGTNTVIK